MDVKIFSHRAACAWIRERPNVYDVIFITNADGTQVPLMVRINARSHINLVFDDIDCPMETYTVPSKEDVARALEFSENKNNIIVTCAGGMSRSAAIAYVILAKRIGAEQAIKLLVPLQHHPNRQIISLAKELLADSSIYKVYNSWIQKPIFKNV